MLDPLNSIRSVTKWIQTKENLVPDNWAFDAAGLLVLV